jgi:hypothetical protein
MTKIQDTKVYSLYGAESDRFFMLAHDSGFDVEAPGFLGQKYRDISLFRQPIDGGVLPEGIYSFNEETRVGMVIPLPGSHLEKIMEKHFPKK